MFTYAFLDISIEAMFSCQSSRFEPLAIFGIVEHILNGCEAFMNPHWISCKDYPLNDDPFCIRSNHRTNGYKFLATLPLPKYQHWTRGIRHRTEYTGCKEASRWGQEAFEFMLITVQVVLTSDDFATEQPHDESAPLVELVPAVAARAATAAILTPVAMAAVPPPPELNSKANAFE